MYDRTFYFSNPTQNEGHYEMKNLRYPLVVIFVFYAFVIPTAFFAVNFFAFPPPSPTVEGIVLVLAEYYGSALGMSFWAFMPPLLYRGYLRRTGKQYSKNTDFWYLIVGGILTLMGLKELGVI